LIVGILGALLIAGGMFFLLVATNNEVALAIGEQSWED